MRKFLIIAWVFADIAAGIGSSPAMENIGGQCQLNGGTLRQYGDFYICYAPSGDAVECYARSGGTCTLPGIQTIDNGKPLQPPKPKGSSGGQTPPVRTGTGSGGTKGTTTTPTTTTTMPSGPVPETGGGHLVAPSTNIQAQKNVRQN